MAIDRMSIVKLANLGEIGWYRTIPVYDDVAILSKHRVIGGLELARPLRTSSKCLCYSVDVFRNANVYDAASVSHGWGELDGVKRSLRGAATEVNIC
jgi:hypothetical protein